MTSGVYQITSGSGRRYVGSSINIEGRWKNHLWELKNNRHGNQFLQREFNKYGETSFTFSILEVTDDTLDREQVYLDRLAPELNLTKDAKSPMKGRLHSVDARAKMRATWSDPALREAQSQRAKARTRSTHTSEGRAAIREGIRKSGKSIPVRCVELGQVFPSAGAAADWCVEQGLTNSPYAAVNITAAAKRENNVNKSAYGFSWQRME